MRTRTSILDSRSSGAFTIVELMISIAMVVILMVGIHQVFKMSTDTVGMGQAVADMSRSNRSVQSIFNDDYQRLMKNAPLFIIRSGVAGNPNGWGAFTTEAERSSDRDNDPLTQDFNSNGTEGEASIIGELTSLATYNSRNHRVDIVGFPANGLFHRHTANDGSYSSFTTSQDAFIYYGHVNLPTATGGTPPVVYYEPGEPAPGNRNNALANQWVLGRVALLMRDFNPGEDFIRRDFGTIPLSPLHFQSVSTGKGYLLTQSRFDLLGASLEQLRQDVADVRANVMAGGFATDGPNSIWWQPVIYKQRPANPPINAPLMRFDCNPRVAKPITSESMAQAMPVLLNNCSQFLVEYAGDFVRQDNEQYIFNNTTKVWDANPNWGNVTDLEPDGVIDYVVDHSKVTNSDYTVSAKTRWYGLPRDTNGDGIITGFATAPGYPRPNYNTSGKYGQFSWSNELVDVVPLRDVVATIRDNSNNPLYPNFIGTAFERELPFYAPNGDYQAAMTNAPPNAKAAFRYTCVWVNSAPTMIRIGVKLEDPAGRLSDGQWFEYVVGAP